MTSDRALKIIGLLGWSQAEAAERFNRIARTNRDRQNINRQLRGRRPVSEGLAVFLRMAVRVAVLERRRARMSPAPSAR